MTSHEWERMFNAQVNVFCATNRHWTGHRSFSWGSVCMINCPCDALLRFHLVRQTFPIIAESGITGKWWAIFGIAVARKSRPNKNGEKIIFKFFLHLIVQLKSSAVLRERVENMKLSITFKRLKIETKTTFSIGSMHAEIRMVDELHHQRFHVRSRRIPLFNRTNDNYFCYEQVWIYLCFFLTRKKRFFEWRRHSWYCTLLHIKLWRLQIHVWHSILGIKPLIYLRTLILE